MSNEGRADRRRTRVVAGTSVIAIALAAGGVLVGVGFAKGSVTAAQSQYGKVAICHRTPSKKHPFVTITISPSAVPAHLRHGDVAGACTTTTTSTTTTTGSTTTTTTAAPTASGPGKSGLPHGNGNGNGNANGHGKK